MRSLTTAVEERTDRARWRMLGLICAGVVLCMTTWFSATAITPELVQLWRLSAGQVAWLTNAVQLGFVTGALLSSFVSLPDLIPLRRLMGVSALVAASANLCLLWVPSVALLLAARFVTGVALAGIYPPALKLISTWFVRGRGTALGMVIAALTLGSALPHLVRFLTDRVNWQAVVVAASVCTLAGAGLMVFFAAEGPFPFSRAVFNPRYVGVVLRNRPLVLANLGYLGHMWELYAMWGWFLAFVRAASPHLGLAGTKTASLVTFAVIASGIVGAVLGGVLADRTSRPFAAGLMMTLSGLCALAIGVVFDGPLWLFLLIAVLWGITVIGDSAQFSAMATELSDPSYVGTALALQLGLGFALTLVSIRFTSVLAAHIGWRWSFLPLAVGPAVGVVAMVLLRRLQQGGVLNKG
ncbi:sugar phosphate permease [Edaphobacter aggregans]|uniref:Sugar phosphate permease n=1 Tax=Edaphobacter aggregans TaxID=570835 RepID=A0A3R9PB04_9BACT|nr:MFS transporter [Edaphobacter aggregans]RSL17671.1 sugar phosphate permease [Edaphobacter aggregans]